jgi:hypothetical protein
VGVVTGVDDTSVGAAGGDDDEDDDEVVGVGVGVVVGGFTGQVGTFVVVVEDGCVGGAGLAESVETGVAGAVRPSSGPTRVGLGVAPVTTGSMEATHRVLDVGCGAGAWVFLDEVVVLPCPAGALPDLAPPVGVPLPLFACVPLPSVPAPPRAGSLLPPFGEVLPWRIAMRTG